MTRTGQCLCGRTGFAFESDPTSVSHCHCESCRRQTGSPFTTFAGVPDARWRWTGEEPATCASSPGVRRRFCPGCGAPVAYQCDRFPGETYFFAGLLDDPGSVRPTMHIFWRERLPWIALADDLPKIEGEPESFS